MFKDKNDFMDLLGKTEVTKETVDTIFVPATHYCVENKLDWIDEFLSENKDVSRSITNILVDEKHKIESKKHLEEAINRIKVEIKEDDEGLYFIIPDEIIEEYGLAEGDELDVDLLDGSIYIKLPI